MRKKYLLGVIFVITLAALLLGWYFFNSAFNFYSVALQNAHTNESVNIKGVEYRVANGVVLFTDNKIGKVDSFRIFRLAYSKTLARKTPTFALPEIDLARFDLAVAALTQSKELLSDLQGTEEEKKLVDSSLYPIDFLESLSVLEKTRRIFLESGSKKSEKLYSRALMGTLKVYENDLKKFRDGFKRAVPETLEKKYVMSDVIIDRQAILGALDILIDRADDIAVHARKRLWCLKGLAILCSSGDTDLLSIELDGSTFVSQESLRLANKVIDLRALVVGTEWTSEAQGIVLLENTCLEGVNAAPFFTFSPQNKSTSIEEYVRPLFVGDIRFIQVREHTDPFSNFLATRGIVFAPSEPLQFYRCLQFGTSHSKIQAVHEISLFSQEYLISDYFSGNTHDKLLMLERLLAIQNDYIKEEDALRYLQVVKSYLSKEILPAPVADRIVSLYVMTTSNTGGLSEDIYRVASVEGRNIRLSARNKVALDFSAPRLFLTESAFFRFFLANRVLSKNEVFQLFPPNTLPAEKQPYVYYSSLKATVGLEDVLVHDLNEYNRIHFDVDVPINK